MKIRFNRLISILCAVMLLIGAFSAWAAAEETPATTTDLKPVEGETVPDEPSEEQPTEPEEKPAEEPEKEPEQESEGEPEGEPADDTVDSVEVLITKTLTMGQSWEGKMKKTKPVVLKLDLNRPCSVYMLVEGRDVWATVEKSDRQTENPSRTKADPETGRMLVKWEAEEGSWLITLGPVEPNLLAEAKVTFMDKKAYDAWEAEQAAVESEPEEEEETEPEPEPEEEAESEPEEEERTEPEPTEDEKNDPEPAMEEDNETKEEESVTEPEGKEDTEPESEEPVETPEEEHAEGSEAEPDEEPENEPVEEEFILPENRKAEIAITWDDEHPTYGSIAHFDAKLIGYEGLDYTLQWQWSSDDEIWTDIAGATDTKMDVVYTQENGSYFWRLIVYIIQPTDI